jgi:hypothetical protein
MAARMPSRCFAIMWTRRMNGSRRLWVARLMKRSIRTVTSSRLRPGRKMALRASLRVPTAQPRKAH